MNQLYSLAREMTNLTDVQIRILDHMEAALQFAADISKNQIYICAKGKNESVEIVLLAAKPSYSMGNTFFDRGDAYLDEEFTLVENVFSTGSKVVGRKELDLGRLVALTAYPIFDNAGIPFAVAAFLSNSQSQQQVLTDTAYMMLQVPMEEGAYHYLRPQDGMVILDSVGRIIYGDEVSGNMILSAWGMPILSGGRVSRTILLLSDVTAIREKERQIMVKDSVIREIHHRVKNSLNTIAGILRMQARRAKDTDTKEALRVAVNRILGISQIHDVLASQSGDHVNWNVFLDKICRLSIDSLAVCPIELVRPNNEMKLLINSEKAVPLAIATSELIHNSIAHGFKGMEDGVLIVSASVENGMLHTCVKNNGHILDTHFSTKSFDLGLQIVRTLIEIELNGSFILENKGDMAEAHIRILLSIMENKR